jgi:hypothetical protein
MRLNVAIAGFFLAAVLSLIAASIQVLRLNVVNFGLVIRAILFLIIALAVHAGSQKGDSPPVA